VAIFLFSYRGVRLLLIVHFVESWIDILCTFVNVDFSCCHKRYAYDRVINTCVYWPFLWVTYLLTGFFRSNCSIFLICSRFYLPPIYLCPVLSGPSVSIGLAVYFSAVYIRPPYEAVIFCFLCKYVFFCFFVWFLAVSYIILFSLLFIM
jgi:hypothetical protein